jgi:hypothetical protein
MKWMICMTALFATTVALSETIINSVTAIPPSVATTATPADPCSYSSSFYDRQNCEQLQRMRAARERAQKLHGDQGGDTPGQTITPTTEMPAWQQALQPKTTPTEQDNLKTQSNPTK